MAWTEDKLLPLSLFFLYFLTAFITFLSACYQEYFSFILSSVARLCFLFVLNMKGRIYPLCAVKVASCSGLTLYCTAHFPEGKRVISLPFGFTVQLSARL